MPSDAIEIKETGKHRFPRKKRRESPRRENIHVGKEEVNRIVPTAVEPLIVIIMKHKLIIKRYN